MGRPTKTLLLSLGCPHGLTHKGKPYLPDEALQEMDVDVRDMLHLVEAYVGSARCLVLSRLPRIPDCVDGLFGDRASAATPATDLKTETD